MAITAAGGGTEEAAAAGAVFAESVINRATTCWEFRGRCCCGRFLARWQHGRNGWRGIVPDSWLSEPGGWGGEPGSFVVSGERRHAVSWLCAPGGGGAVRDGYR